MALLINQLMQHRETIAVRSYIYT